MQVVLVNTNRLAGLMGRSFSSAAVPLTSSLETNLPKAKRNFLYS